MPLVELKDALGKILRMQKQAHDDSAKKLVKKAGKKPMKKGYGR